MSERADAVVRALAAVGATVAVAESLTGGLVTAAITDVPGASVVLRGGMVTYATDLKHALLGVDAGLLAEHGAVHLDVAAQMARGVRERLGATYGLATTGVAGPDPQDGRPIGTVYVAVDGPAGDRVAAYDFAGDRAAIREQTVAAALEMLRQCCDGPREGDGLRGR